MLDWTKRSVLKSVESNGKGRHCVEIKGNEEASVLFSKSCGSTHLVGLAPPPIEYRKVYKTLLYH